MVSALSCALADKMPKQIRHISILTSLIPKILDFTATTSFVFVVMKTFNIQYSHAHSHNIA